MSWHIGIITALLVYAVVARVSYEECQKYPKDRHCIIEWMCRKRWPHQVRWVYNWRTEKCFTINWADHCPPVPEPPTTNNFPTEADCITACTGWI